MPHINIEIKARSTNTDKIKEILLSKNAEFKGTDYQTDTYFKVPNGRLKLREGNIENCLIQYSRENQASPKQSNVILYNTNKNSPGLREILIHSLGILAIVEKQREIYFIDNVKFHIDKVRNLGNFVEIEAINYKDNLGKEKLLQQCNFYKNLFNIRQEDLISCSYSDLILEKLSEK